ncbi:creatininase family protein, partial [Klebsiella pneumoniae]|nr:creatininase family protein [Klebsiella pneumoniae]
SGVAGDGLGTLPPRRPDYAVRPVVCGQCEEYQHLTGTLTLIGDTLLHTFLEIAESLYRALFRKLLMINGHGRQPHLL